MKPSRFSTKISAAALAAVLVLCSTACSQSGGTTTTAATTTAASTTTTPATLKEEHVEVVDEIKIDGAKKLDNGTVKWLSFWDINPANGKAVPTELELFDKNYGGSIEYIPCTWDNRFDQLGTLVASGSSPDLFPAADLDVFPRCALSNLFSPLDDYLDLSSDLWKDMSSINDIYTIKGRHYVCNMSTDVGVIMIYNKKVVEENGLDDPAELVAKGEWTWDTFYDMMLNFCDRNENKFALDGWWFEAAISITTGVPYVSFNDGVITQNLNNAMLFKAQEFMEKINKQDFPYPKAEHQWQVSPSNIGDGLTLFYPVGIWQLYEADLTAFGDMEDIMFVPMPRCPDADAYYLPTGVDAMAMVSSGPNPEGAAAFLTCRRTAAIDPQTLVIQKEQFVENYGWTQAMLDMYDTTKQLTSEHPMIEFYGAVSPTLNDLLNNPMKDSFNNGKSWTQTASEIQFAVDAEIEKANESLASRNN